jgi:nitroreductase
VDTFLAIASKRDERRYAVRTVPEEVRLRILDAGRLAGSARNRQPWTFVVVDERREQLAELVYAPANVSGAAFVVAIATQGSAGFDAGRAAQNMVLAAWNEGVVSCPNGMPDADAVRTLLGLADDQQPVIVLSFGYPERERNPERRSAEEWSARANRKPLDELVTRA